MVQELPAPGDELVVVRAGHQQFAVEIMSVREIRGWTQSTPLPHSPDYVLGMINLRGAVLPVIDLAARLGLGRTTPGRSSVVVVVQVGHRQVGLLVDEVCDILTVEPEGLREVPDMGGCRAASFLRAVMIVPDGIVALLSLLHVLGETDEEMLAA